MELTKEMLISNSDLLKELNSNVTGLSDEEVLKRREKFGFNELKKEKSFSVLKIFISQFTSIFVIILIIAGLLSLFLGEMIDGIGIFSIIIINGIIGFFQEYKAENTLATLKQMTTEKAIVIRNGKKELVDTKEVVPGDIIFLEEGAKIPADARVLESFSMKVDEAIITGESFAVEKKVITNIDEKNAQECNLFSSTLVVAGSATALIYGTGMNTSFGRIASLVMEEEKETTLLDKQLDDLAKKLGIFIVGLVTIIFILGFVRNISVVEMFMVSVSLGVSAIPEGLPIIVTLTLALGIQAIAKQNALVRKMSVVESLGAATVICSDKTGTLTKNEMTVTKIFASVEKNILGTGYLVKSFFVPSVDEKRLLEVCQNCNNSFVEGEKTVGDPTEIALKVLALKSKYVNEFKKIDELAFNSTRKMMSTLHSTDKQNILFVKGAPEEVLKNCTKILQNGKIITFDKKTKDELLAKNCDWANQALRVIACAYKETSETKCNESDLVFVGLVGMFDPPREEVKEALALAKQAQIDVKIITGDNELTAKAIAENIGLKVRNIVLGKDIDALSDDALKVLIKDSNLFARTNPEHKYRIVSLLKEMGEIVAVTGDGVNDAPALKKADIGIAMGIKGTSVSKEASDIILQDDNFATIISIIREGRRVYANIISFIKFLLSANFVTLAVVGLVTLVGLPLPLLPLQILWINIATDSLPALALGVETADKKIMNKQPHKKGESFIKKMLPFLLTATIFQIIANGILVLYGFHLDALAGINSFDLAVASFARTLFFTQTVLFELLLVFNCRGIGKSILRHGFFENKKLVIAVLISLILQLMLLYVPFFNVMFKTIPLGFDLWLIMLVLVSPTIIIPQVVEKIEKILKIQN
ncbi:MAG: cation-translocating P-type ATPase [archaeon]|jgi:Ca2+-transporting ATPase